MSLAALRHYRLIYLMTLTLELITSILRCISISQFTEVGLCIFQQYRSRIPTSGRPLFPGLITDLLSLTEPDSINDAVDDFYDILDTLVDNFVLWSHPRRKKYSPWFSGNVIDDLRLKECFHRKFQQTVKQEVYCLFREIRGRVETH